MRALPAPQIPTHLEDLTPEWLTQALRARSVLRGARVEKVRSERLGVGEGFVGAIIRLELSLDGAEDGAPRTLIAKLPIAVDQNRMLGELLGAYEREIRFYDALADKAGIRTPRCYYSAMDRNPAEGKEEQILAAAERIPGWLIRWLMPLFTWLARRSKRRYVLLLEDLAPARVGDQVAGCTPETAQAAVRALAGAHAALWEHAELGRHPWLGRVDALARYFHSQFRRERARFFRGLGAELPAGAARVAGWLDANGVAVVRRLGRFPQTLVHGDYRLDNLFFADDGVVAIDWQGVSRGPGPWDLAYFVGGNLASSVAAACERDLLELYVSELRARGVDFSLDACWRCYQLSKLAIFHRVVAGAHMLELYDARGVALMRAILERQAALLPEDCDELLA